MSISLFQSITAIWLANNQTKPLVQLNTDLDPVTGLKVLTNFLLPQQVKPFLLVTKECRKRVEKSSQIQLILLLIKSA